jgi:hypothetical protein
MPTSHFPIILLKRGQIDGRAWDDCVDNSPQAQPYARSWYLDLIAPGWKALVQKDGEGGYQAVLPLPWRRKWRIGRPQVVPPLFSQQLGVFGSCPDPAVWLDLARAQFRQIRINWHAGDDPKAPGFQASPRLNMTLPLGRDMEEIRQGYNSNTKRNLKKAQNAGWVLDHEFHEPEFMNSLIQNQGPKIEGVGRQDYELVGKIIHQALELREGSYLAARNPAGELGAAVFTLSGSRGPCYMFGTSSESGRKDAAMPLLFDNLFEHHLGQERFDFEGSQIPGLARFYKGFGALEETYWQLASVSD